MFSKTLESIGVEVECGIGTQKLATLTRKYSTTGRFQPGTDGSVNVPSPSGRPFDIGWIKNEEMRYWTVSKADLENFFKDVFTNNHTSDALTNTSTLGALTNSSCGMHVHLRMNPNLMWQWSYGVTVRKFVSSYRTKFANNPKYMNRLRNHYSKANYNIRDAISQVTTSYKNSSRYHAVNLNAYTIAPSRGTMEIRILPGANSATEAIEMINWIVKTVDDINIHPNKTLIFSRESSRRVHMENDSNNEFKTWIRGLKSELENSNIDVRTRRS